jgi:plasmid stabilization system protein ParE
MRRNVVWAPEALRDVGELLAYIAADNQPAARAVRDRIDAAVKLLADEPIGHPGRVVGTYEKRVLNTHYIIAYELPRENQLHILRVIHSSRDWQPGTWPDD